MTGHVAKNVDRAMVKKYIIHLETTNAPKSRAKDFKPALDFYRYSLGKDSQPFTKINMVASLGVQVRAKKASKPFKKADALPIDCIEKLVQRNNTAHGDQLFLQPLYKIRATIFALTGFFIIGTNLFLYLS